MILEPDVVTQEVQGKAWHLLLDVRLFDHACVQLLVLVVAGPLQHPRPRPSPMRALQ